MYLEFPAQAPYAYSVSDTGGSEEKKLRRPPGGKFMSKIFLPKTMVSVLHTELTTIQSGKAHNTCSLRKKPAVRNVISQYKNTTIFKILVTNNIT